MNIKDLFQKLKKKLRYKLNEESFKKETKLLEKDIVQVHDDMNVVLITFDSCRFDSMKRANTPNLDRLGEIYSAWTPGTYTLPAHISFFTGIFPMVNEDIPYLNRFSKQLITMKKAGQAVDTAKSRRTISLPASSHDMIYALKKAGYYTVGAGAATWFAKHILTQNFHDFKFKQAMSATEQCNFLLKNLATKSNKKPFFAFMNFIETHTPYMHYGSDRDEYAMQARDFMSFPPREDTYMKESTGHKLHQAQISAVEHLDKIMGEFLQLLPKKTFVIITADHGEAFGEDGFWGHGVYHPTVMNVPMMCFMLNGEKPLEDK
jgi:membrane-anchored protein YejM (alkaline phosphatase superfamily)